MTKGNSRLQQRLTINLAVWAALHVTICFAEPDDSVAEINSMDAAIIGGGTDDTTFWKPELHFGVTGGVVFEDNLFITPDNEVSDTVLVASARVTVAFGNVQSWAARFIDTSSRALLADAEEGSENLLAVTYSPAAQYFTDNDSLNTVDHDVAATARWQFTKLRLALDGRFQTLSDPDPDLGRRADRKLTSAHLQVNYDWTEKTTLETDLDFQNRDYEEAQDSSQWEADAFVLFQVLPKTAVGFGLAGGQLQLDGGDSQNFQQALLRARYNSYSKITVTATAGAEWRQISSGGDETNGVFQIGLAYELSENTQFYLSAYQRTEASADGNSQSIERTSFAIGMDQKLFQKILLSANLDYTLADYSTPDDRSSRTDHLLSLSTTLTFEVTQNGFVRLGYTYHQNDSDLPGNSYESNQFVFSVTALF